MGRLGTVRVSIAVTGVVLVALSGCSSGKKSTPTTTTSVSSSVPESSTTGSTAPSPTTASSLPVTTTTTAGSTTTGAGPGPSISGFTITPARPVCSAPTQIQLQWTAANATTVALSIDGTVFASYAGGAQSHLEYFACDGKAHTYLLTAHSGTRTAVASKVVTSVTPSN